MINQFKALKNLNNRVVVITGASSGLGEQIAYQAAKRGAIVVGCARNMDRLNKVINKCKEYQKKLAFAFQLDVSDPKQIENVVSQIESTVGPIDVLINDAGFGLMEDALNFDMDIAEKMFRVNVLGLMYMTKYTALHMARRKSGAIVNIASVAGKIATPKSSIYSATKFAVIGYSNALRLELKPLGISVLTVNPGPIRTNFFNIADKTGKYLENVGGFALNPELVAEKVVGSIGTNRRELTLPGVFICASHLYNLFPYMGDYLTSNVFNKK